MLAGVDGFSSFRKNASLCNNLNANDERKFDTFHFNLNEQIIAHINNEERRQKYAAYNYPQHRSTDTAAKDFIRKLMCKDVSKRVTCKQALQHTW